MGPQNSDPKDPNTPPVQPDLSSILSSSPVPQPTQPEPNPISPPPIPPPEPEPAPIEPVPAPLPYGIGPVPEPPPPEPPAEPSSILPIDSRLNPGFNWSSPISPPPPPPEQYSSPTPVEGGPTDLSQLATQSSEPQSVPAPETLVVPTANVTAEPVTLQAESGGRGIPKWVWGVGGGLLLLVIGASAYLFLGIGQAPKPASIPATQQQQLVAPPAPPPVTKTPAATPPEGFGTLPGEQQATSAADLLRQRQQQGK